MAWGIEFYEDEDGCPLREFLDGLERARRAKVLAVIHLLAEKGPTLPFPYSSQLRHKLRELRTSHAGEQYRVLYFGAPNRTFVLLHGLSKHSVQVPERDIAIAQARMDAYLRAARKGGRSDQ